jgi:hypothetical protein
MKRFHVHAHVEDLVASITFYSKMFAAEPTRVEADYAKWMLEDPRINFAISTRGGKTPMREPVRNAVSRGVGIPVKGARAASCC